MITKPHSSSHLPTPPDFSLPPLQTLSFVPLLFLICLLLQPSVPARLSRVLRLVLLLPTAYLAWTSTFTYRIQPVEWAITANFRWGIFSTYFLWKTGEWCLASGAAKEKELAWVGFDGKDAAKLHADKEGKAETLVDSDAHNHNPLSNRTGSLRKRYNGIVFPQPVRPPPPALAALHNGVGAEPQQLPTPTPSPPFIPPQAPSTALSAVQRPSLADSATPSSRLTPVTHAKTVALRSSQRAHPLRVLADATHLLTSLRGVGYAWGPPQKSLPPSAPSHGAFLRRSALEMLKSHIIDVTCLALQVHHRDELLAPLLSSTLPPLFPTPAAAEPFASLLARLCVGIDLYVQMLIGFNGTNMSFLLLSHVTNSVLDSVPEEWGWTWRAVFDTREYAPLFDSPFSKMGDGGVSAFWGKRWHALFRASFTALGFRPSMSLARCLRVPSSFGRLLGAGVVFAMSGWMHWQAIYSARLSDDPTPSGLTFLTQHSLSPQTIYPPPWSTLSFTERHGTWIFFLLQPVAVAAEVVWVASTGRSVGGWVGRVWTMGWIVGLGQAAVGRS
ncbi:hypothetical protein JCM11641_007869, partial [Rhodosporidiobolus odoratus]